MPKCKKMNQSKILYFIFSAFGLDLAHEKESMFRSKFAICARGISVSYLSFGIIIEAINLPYMKIESKDIKPLIGFLVQDAILISLWLCVWLRKKELAKSLKAIGMLAKQLELQLTYRFQNVCIIFSIAAYVISVVLYFYPLTEDWHEKRVSELPILSILCPNANMQVYFLYAFEISYQATLVFFPACFVLLYVIQCHTMQSLLSNASIRSETANHAVRRLREYSDILHVLKTFESAASMPIFLAFTYLMFTLLYYVLEIVMTGENIYHLLCVYFILMTLLIFTASRVHESEKRVKDVNHHYLDVIIANHPSNHCEIRKFERIINSPAFTLTAGDFFRFTRGLYPNVIGCLLTYTLLMLNL